MEDSKEKTAENIKGKTNRKKTHIALYVALAFSLAVALSVFFLGVINRWEVTLTLNGDKAITLEYGDQYKEKGATARFHGSLAFSKGWELEVQETGSVDETTLGTYTLTYTASKWRFSAQEERTVTVVDTQPPEIALATVDGSYTLPGQSYQEEGFTATDNYDGDITDQVISTEADGVVTYTVSDSSGNETTVTRTIYYNDPIPPELTLVGDAEITITAGDGYTEPGYSASDNVDGDITDRVTIEGQVDPDTAGTYTLTYTVADSYGNTVSAQRTITVKEKPKPQPASTGQAQATPSGQAGKTIYLTFDDGPGAYTESLLNVLDQYGVKVTFFTCSNKYAYLIKEEASRGHAVGVHSATHDYGKIYASEDAFFADLNQQRQLIYDQTGSWTSLIRFPGGSSNKVSAKYCTGIMSKLVQSVTDQGYQYFDWNVTSGDAGDTTSTDTVYQNVISGIQKQTNAGKDSVVLQHDIKDFSVAAVEKIIQWGLANGYTFSALDTSSPAAHHHVNN